MSACHDPVLEVVLMPARLPVRICQVKQYLKQVLVCTYMLMRAPPREGVAVRGEGSQRTRPRIQIPS